MLSEPITELVTLGGGSRSPVWCQIIADATRRRLEVVREPESTCLGAGMLAAAAVGIHGSIPEAAHAMSGRSAVFEPQDETADVYDRLYDVYRDIYPANRDLFARLAEVTA